MFENSPIKREVQRILFKNITADKVLGLAGPHPEEYINILSTHTSKVILCDYNPVNDTIIKCSLVGTFEQNDVDWVDADFCSSIVTNELDIYYLFNKLKSLKKSFNFSFTLSQHSGQKQEELLKKLSSIFGITVELDPIEIRQYPGTGKYIHIYKPVENLQLIGYRDSGDNMITGLYSTSVVSKPIEVTNKPIKKNSKRKKLGDIKKYNTARFKELQNFIESTGRKPKHTRKNKEERLLYMWMYNILNRGTNTEFIDKINKLINEQARTLQENTSSTE